MSPSARPLGVSVMPLENRREAILRIATTADRLGYAAFFLPETWAHDTTLMLADIAGRARRIRLASGVLGVWGRSAATLAMAAATLDLISEGRFTLGLGASTVAALQQPEVHAVNSLYEPVTITVSAGTTVRFINDDNDIHTITARGGGFDSGLMFQGQIWTYTFNNPGTYEYFCLPHPWMVGTIVVE